MKFRTHIVHFAIAAALLLSAIAFSPGASAASASAGKYRPQTGQSASARAQASQPETSFSYNTGKSITINQGTADHTTRAYASENEDQTVSTSSKSVRVTNASQFPDTGDEGDYTDHLSYGIPQFPINETSAAGTGQPSTEVARRARNGSQQSRRQKGFASNSMSRQNQRIAMNRPMTGHDHARGRAAAAVIRLKTVESAGDNKRNPSGNADLA